MKPTTERQKEILTTMAARGTMMADPDDADMTALHAAGLVFRRDGPPTAWPTLTWGLTSELANYGQPETLSPAAQRLSDARHAENAAEKKVARLKAELLAAQEESTEATARVVDAQDEDDSDAE